jgi:plastocyanin
LFAITAGLSPVTRAYRTHAEVIAAPPLRHASGANAIERARHPADPTSRRAATGRIEGVVEISTALSSRRPQFRIYSDPGTGATPPPPPRDQLAAELRNVVVYLDGDSAKVPADLARVAAKRRGSMSQKGERFQPHVLPVVVGATVEFPNDDDVYHNVFSFSSAAGANGFDLGRYPKGSSRSITFSKPGTVQVFCHIHSDMSGVVLVLSNPFFTSPDETHRFSMDDVPEGDYTIVGWHEHIRPVTRRVHVSAGQTTTVEFNIPLPQGGPR